MATTLSQGAEMPIRSQSVRTPRRPPSSRPDPLPTRSESTSKAESSRAHRRSNSQRSTSSPRHQPPPEAPAPPPAVSNGPDSHHHHRDAADPSKSSSSRPSKHRYRTVIQTESGNYSFIKTIGQGSMGKVKLAKKEGTGELASCTVPT